MRAADLSHLRELSFHFWDSGSLRPSPSLNLSSGQSIHLLERPNVWKNEVGSRKRRLNKCFCVNGRFGAFASIVAYSGYHGEIEGSADEAQEWPAGSGFSHLWGTAQVLHSSSCQLTDGASPGTALWWRELPYPSLVPPLGCLLLIQTDVGLQRPDPLASVWSVSEGPPSLRAPFGIGWGLSFSSLTLPTSPFAQDYFLCSHAGIDPREPWDPYANLRATFLGRTIYATISICYCPLSLWEESSTLKCSLKNIDITLSRRPPLARLVPS